MVIADGAAFGSEIDKILKLIEGKNNIELFLPKSFEWLILQSDIINNKELKVILQNTYDYVESKDYLSWERYFTNLLIELTQDTYLKYNKSVLNEAYLQDKVQKKIIDEINIDFEWKKDRNNKCEEE